MKPKKLVQGALAAAAITPNIVMGPAVHAGTKGHVMLAQAEKKLSKAELKRAQAQVRTELSRLSAAEKKRMGAERVNLSLVANQQLAISKCCHTISQGVGCGGTPAATQGVTCCVVFQANN